MPSLNSPYISRRAALVLGAATLGTRAFGQAAGTPNELEAAPPVDVSDRGIANSTGNGPTSIRSCVNDGVVTSDGSIRLVQPGDFEAANTCTMIPDSFEGPYFICTGNRGKSIAANRVGEPLTLAYRILDTTCAPLPGAILDVWACDATGHYSGHDTSADISVPVVINHIEPSTEERFCRGVLAADEDGIVEFDTIYPGYYAGRAVHIHFKVHWQGRSYLTNQSHLPEVMNGLVLGTSPYDGPRNFRRTLNRDEDRLQLTEFSVGYRADRLTAVLNVMLPEA